MTDESKVPSGEPNQNPVDMKGKDDVVAYESYQKVLSEKKNLQAKFGELQGQMNELISSQKAQEEAKLNEAGEFKKLAELKDQKISELQAQIDSVAKERDAFKGDLNDTWKLQAFYSKLNGTVKRNEYLSFVDLDGIVIDPETRQVDETSVENVVAKFMENHGDLVQTKKVGSLPSDAPKGVSPKSFSEMSSGEQSVAMQKILAANMKRK